VSANNLHRSCDRFTGTLIYAMIIFSPWAFGTTESWSIRIMNVAGLTLGALLALKYSLRRSDSGVPDSRGRSHALSQVLTGSLAAVTLLLLAWCGLSAWNASATYSAVRLQFEYRDYISWLPHSLDSRSSWQAFENFTALACTFWAVRDWLLTRSDPEQHDHPSRTRLRRLIWVLALNAALVALVGIFQRADGGGKLLWLVQPDINRDAEAQFGPYAYRGNAAQLFNLIWPTALGLWCLLHRHHRPGRPPLHHLLLSCVLILASAPFMTGSRAGAIIAAGSLGVSCLLFLRLLPGEPWFLRAAPAFCALCALILGLNLGGDILVARLRTIDEGLARRDQTYATARRIAADYPWFGTGPGTFDPVFQLYRNSPDEYWPGQLHNDWLETRLTFGRIGFAFCLAALALVASRWFLPGGIAVPWTLPAFLWVSLAGCLLHARFDFPLQIYSILLVFLVNCAILTAISRKR
jgi:hypothetical protein